MADATLSMEARFKDFASLGIDGVAAKAVKGNDAITASAKVQEQQMNKTRETFSRSLGAANGLSMSMGPLGDSFGRTGQAVAGAVNAVSLFSSGLGVAGLAVAAASLGLSAFINYLDKAATAGKDPKIFGDPARLAQVKNLYEQYITAAAKGSVYQLSELKDKMKDLGLGIEQIQQMGGLQGLEKTLTAAKDKAKGFNVELVHSAELAAKLAMGKQDPLSQMKISHQDELKQLTGDAAERKRITKAFAEQEGAEAAQIQKDWTKKSAAAAIDARLAQMKDGEAKELAALKVQGVKMLVEAQAQGVESGKARNDILVITEEQAKAIHLRYEKLRLEFTKAAEADAAQVHFDMLNSEWGAEQDLFSKEAAALEERYRLELLNAEKIGADTSAIRQKYADLRIVASNEETKRQMDNGVKYYEAYTQLATAGLSFGSAINDVERQRDKRRTAEHIALVDQQVALGTMTLADGEQKKRKLQEDADKRDRERAKKAKMYAIAEAIANIALGVTKAIAQGGFLGLITGAAVGVAGAAQIATIQAQEFEEGGFPVGQNALIRVNEDGRQEAVLNAGAVQRLGRNNIDNLNAGGSIHNVHSDNRSEYRYAPTTHLHVTPDTVDVFLEVLNRQPDRFFQWMNEKQSKGYGR